MASTSLNFDIYAKDHASSTFDRFGKSVSESEKHTSSLGKGLKVLATAFAGLAVIQKTTQFMSDSIEQARESQKVNALTAAAIKSTGGAANVTADQISDLANTQSLKIGVDDETIQSAENLMLTFRGVRDEAGKGNDIFSRSIVVAENMSAAFGTSLPSATKVLGKALNDPIAGLSALTRVGVTFTDQQKAQITALVESGHKMKAQKLIIGELNKETKGAAESQATAGDRAKVAWENLQETIGNKLLPILDKLEIWFVSEGLPALSKLGSALQANLIPAFAEVGSAIVAMQGPTMATFGFLSRHTGTVKLLASLLAGMTAGILAIAAATKVWAAIQLVLNFELTANPIGLVVVALAALAAGIIYAYKHSKTFQNVIHGLSKTLSWLTDAIGKTISWIRDHWKLLAAILLGPIAAAAYLVISHWKQITDATSSAWGKVKDLTRGAWNAVKDILRSAWDGIKNLVSDGAGRVVDFIASIPDRLANLAGRFGGAGKALIRAFVDGLKNANGIIEGIAANVWDAVRGMLNQAIGQINAALSFSISVPGPDIHIDVPDIPYLARGGIVTRPTFAVLGESGPEAVLPLSGRYGGYGDGTVANLHVTLQLDGRDVQKSLLKLKRLNGGLTLGLD